MSAVLSEVDEGAETVAVYIDPGWPRAGSGAELGRFGVVIAGSVATAQVILTAGGDVSGFGLPVVSVGGRSAAAGWLSVDASEAQIAAALHAVAAGLVVRSADADEGAFAPVGETAAADLLTPREVEVLSAIGEGCSNKVIARRLNLSLHTVKFYIEAIFRKLEAHSRTEAVAKGLMLARRL